MASIDLLLLALGCSLSAATAWQVLSLSRAVEVFSRQFRRDAASLLDLRYRKAANGRLHSVQQFAESAVDTGTLTAHHLHRSAAQISFGTLESISAIRAITRIVREAHDLVSDFVYGSIRYVNKAAGNYTRGAIDGSTTRREDRD